MKCLRKFLLVFLFFVSVICLDLDDYSEYGPELTAEKFLGLEQEGNHQNDRNFDNKDDHNEHSQTTEVKDNHKRDYHEMIDGLIRDWYNPAKYLESGGYLSPESSDPGKEFLKVQTDNSTSVLDKIKKTLKKVFNISGYDEEDVENLLTDHDSEASLIEPLGEGLMLANTTILSTTTSMPLLTTTMATNVSESLERYPKIFRQFSETDMEFLKHFLSCLRKSTNITSALPVKVETTPMNPTTVATTTTTSSKLANTSVSSVITSPQVNISDPVQHQHGNESNFVLKCVRMPSSVENEMMSFNCTKQLCPDFINNTTPLSPRNVTMERNNTKEALLENKLKYLAHIHHPISMVGKLPPKPLNLANVQKIIDDAKNKMFLENDDIPVLDETGNDTNESGTGLALMKRSRLTRDYYSDDETGDYDDKELASLDYIGDYNEFKGKKRRNKKRKKERQRNKSHKNVPENENDPQSPVSSPLSDFSEIQLKLTPEQEMDIHKFEADLSASPEPFHFDLDRFMKEKSLERVMEAPSQQEATTRRYFEFAKTANKRSNHQKRDLQTKLEAYRNLVRGDKETYSPNLAYNYNDDYTKNYRKQFETPSKEDKDSFIDKYYLLNDGDSEAFQELSRPNTDHEKTPNLLDLDIDLRLNKEFQDLEYEKEKVLQGEGDIKDAIDDSTRDHIYHFGAIR